MKILTSFLSLMIISTLIYGQNKRVLVYDIFHGQNSLNANKFTELLDSQNVEIRIDSAVITNKALDNIYGLIIFSPNKPFTDNENESIIKFIKKGGSLLLIFDKEKRTPIHRINNILKPFDLELTETIPYIYNCGAIAEKSYICAEQRELPYSGGRSVKGGTIVSKVFMDGDFVHCAYKEVKNNKLIVMSDGMTGLLMGQSDGIRLTGTKPSDTKYWGKDSKIFMKEILIFFMK